MTFSCSPRTIPTRSPTWSWTPWPTACHGASASTRAARCRCCARCTEDQPARACSTSASRPRRPQDEARCGGVSGGVGVVTPLSVEDREVRVLLDEDEEVAYGFDELDELTHAYAVSIHRSQGSEYPCVVVALTMSAWLMLQRNLLYTAVTRAKQLVVLVGSRRALAQ